MALFKPLVVLIFLILSVFAVASAHAQEVNAERAKLNYILNCQGCHLPDGSGFPDKIPTLKNYVGKFLQVKGGREFLIQVPGSANAPLDDPQLAELLNWMLVNFSPEQLPDNYQPFSAAEVGRYRQDALIEINGLRAELVKKIEALKLH